MKASLWFLDETNEVDNNRRDRQIKECEKGRKSSLKLLLKLAKLKLLNSEEKQKYDFILGLYNRFEFYNNEIFRHYKEIAEAMINNELTESIECLLYMLLGDEELDLEIMHGSSSLVFIMPNYVLKLGIVRYQYKCPNHFRIVPSILREEILDDDYNPIFYIEIQRTLDTNNINLDDREDAIIDLLNDGIEPVDSLIKEGYPYNFGYLKDYKDYRAVIPVEYGGIIESPKLSEMSDSFKRNPLVVIDTESLYIIGSKELEKDDSIQKYRLDKNKLLSKQKRDN